MANTPENMETEVAGDIIDDIPPVPVKWTPPEDTAPGTYVMHESKHNTTGEVVYRYWVTDPADEVLALTQIRDDAVLFYKGSKVTSLYTHEDLRHPRIVRAICVTAEVTYTETRKMAHPTELANKEVSKRSREDEKLTYRVQAPEKWDSTGKSAKTIANSLLVWLIE